MGVDFEVITAIGYCININQLTPEERKCIEDIISSDISSAFQDCYGNSDKSAQALIYINSTQQKLVSYSVGWTPFSFLNNQVYTGCSNTLRGGAKECFAVSMNYSNEERKGWRISSPCDECIKSYKATEGNINHYCECTKDDFHLKGNDLQDNQELLNYKKQLDDFLIENKLERLTLNTINFSRWLFSYYW